MQPNSLVDSTQFSTHESVDRPSVTAAMYASAASDAESPCCVSVKVAMAVRAAVAPIAEAMSRGRRPKRATP